MQPETAMNTPYHPQSLDWNMLCQIVDALGIGVMVFSDDKRLLIWNRWLARHSELSAEQMCGRAFAELFPNLRGSRVEAAIDIALQQGYPSFLSQSLNKAPFDLNTPLGGSGGSTRIQQSIQVVPISGEQGQRYCLLQVNDVTAAVMRETALRRQTEELAQHSYQDALTGIANRRRFNEKLDEEFSRAARESRPLSLLMLDIDYFKRYNATYGHQRGDQCLQQIARRIERSLRKPGDLIARYGGEEFALILPDTDGPSARKYAERLMLLIAELGLTNPGSDVSDLVTLSIGVATLEHGVGQEPSSLIMAADLALYRAKQQGRARIAVHSADQA